MTVLVPPAVFGEVKRVLDLPVSANGRVQLGRRDRGRVDTGHEIPTLVLEHFVNGGTQLAIDANADLAIRKVQTLADIPSVVEVEPTSADFGVEPLFSVVS